MADSMAPPRPIAREATRLPLTMDEVLALQAGHRAGIADDLQPVLMEEDLRRLVALIIAVVHRVAHRLFDRGERVADPDPALGLSRHLLDPLGHPSLERAHTVPELLMDGTAEGLFVEQVASVAVLREFDSRPGKGSFRVIAEEHQRHVAGHLPPVGPGSESQPPVDLGVVGFVEQATLGLAQVLPQQTGP